MEEKKPNLLLIDDEEPFCIVNANILRLAGYTAEYVLSAEQGIEYIQKNPDTDIVLLDIDLGEGLKGTEALPILIENQPALQVIMITSNRDINIGVDCMKKGAFDYLTKPFIKQNLFRTIRSAIARKKIIQLKNLYLEILVHDLKNPVQSIVMGLDAMDVDDTQIREKAFNLAKFGCWQIQSMVSNILTITQFEKASPTLHLEKIICDEVMMKKEIKSLVDRIRFTGRKFELKFTGRKTHLIVVEKNLFFQIINNLLSNAIRFTKKDDTIILEISRKDKEYIKIMVKNTGSFIEQEIRDKIFDKFFKPQFQGKHQGRNFGLGLTFCKHAVASLDGKIWVESTPDPPATSFFFTVKKGS